MPRRNPPRSRASRTRRPLGKRRRLPVRTCVACRQEAGKAELVRLVRDESGSVVIDVEGRAPGRGAYLHRSPECVSLARRRGGLARALKAAVPAETWIQLEAT